MKQSGKNNRNLQDAYEMLKNAGRVAKFGGWYVLLNENHCYWSDEVSAIHEKPTGFSPKVQDAILFYAPEWRERITALFADCAQKGISYDEELEILTSSGKRVWVRTNGEAVRDENGVIYKVQGGFQEITEQKKVEQKFRELMKRHKTFIDTVPDIIMEVDRSKIYTWGNKAGYEFFGDDVIGKEASYYFEGDQAVYEKVEPLFKGKEDVIYLESYQRRKDGKIRLLAWWCKVYKDTDGNTIGAISSARDITEKKELENSLIKSEEKYRQLVNNAMETIVVAQDGLLKFANPIALSLLEVDSEDDLINKPFITYIHPEDARMVGENYQRRMQLEEVKNDYEFRIVSKKGKLKWVEIHASLFEWEGKRATLNFLTDVTLRKEAEIELKKKVSELQETNSLMVNRELRMIELKKEVNELLKAFGKDEKYEC
ncbi:MAG: PAS domain S-box protein [Candidatus Delongbacteria bacterium]|nr:PAS domain S-box protein [Candidatus Delongbacteria bacterium]